MTGRLETKIKYDKKIENILKTMPDIIKEYSYYINDKESSTQFQYLSKIRVFINYCKENIDNFDIFNITAIDISKYMKHISTRTFKGEVIESSRAYLRQNYAALKSLFDFFEKFDYYGDNPMKRIEKPRRTDDIKKRFLTTAELKKILDVVDFGAGTIMARKRQQKWRSRDKAILTLFIHTGIRETALTEINISDIDFQKNTITVVDKGHKTHIYEINLAMKTALLNWLKDRKDLLEDESSNALFISNLKQRISPHEIARIVKIFSKEALGEEVTPHKLRAALCNTLLNESGGDLYFVSKVIGHASVSTTKLYVSDDTKRHRDKAIQITERLFE